jgi:hypothetical protein
VIEENLYHGGIVNDEMLVEFCQGKGIRLEDFRTYRNKVDKDFGVSGLTPRFAEKRIHLPYGDSPSQAKSDLYRAQLIYWDGKVARNRNARAGYKSDIVMASWFPLDAILRAQTEFIAEMGVDYEPDYASFDSYGWDRAPWDSFEEAVG